MNSDQLISSVLLKIIESGVQYNTVILGTRSQSIVQYKDFFGMHLRKLDVVYQGPLEQCTQQHSFDTIVLMNIGISSIDYIVGVIDDNNTLQWLTDNIAMFDDSNNILVEYYSRHESKYRQKF